MTSRGDQRAEGVEDRLRPGRHLLRPRCRAGSRAPGRRRRTAAGTPRPSGAGGAPSPPRARRTAPARDLPVPARPPSETMPTSGSSSRSRAIRCSARAAVDAERLAVAAHQADLLVRRRPGPAPLPRSESSTSPVWQGRSRAASRSSTPVVVQRRRGRAAVDLELGHAGPAGVDGELGAVLLGVEADGRRLDPHRQVLGDQRDVVALVGEVAGDREDPGVVVAEPEARRAATRGSVWLSSTRRVPPSSPTGTGSSSRPWLTRRSSSSRSALPGEVAELGVVPLALELGDHHDREDDLVLVRTAAARRGRPAGRWCRGRRSRAAGSARSGVTRRACGTGCSRCSRSTATWPVARCRPLAHRADPLCSRRRMPGPRARDGGRRVPALRP